MDNPYPHKCNGSFRKRKLKFEGMEVCKCNDCQHAHKYLGKVAWCNRGHRLFNVICGSFEPIVPTSTSTIAMNTTEFNRIAEEQKKADMKKAIDISVLMINDWILAGNVPYLVKDVDFTADWDKEWYEPLPLTLSMIEQNGWKRTNMRDSYIIPANTATLLVYCNGGFMWNCGFSSFCVFNYVHELQHALRLVGLNELADNWRVK